MTIGSRLVVAHVAALAFAASLSTASADSVRVRAAGVGIATCSDVVAKIEAHREAVANQLAGWAYGYMTRRNIERALAGQSQAELTPENFNADQLVGLIIGFCKEQPNTRIYEVVDALYEILLEKGSLVS